MKRIKLESWYNTAEETKEDYFKRNYSPFNIGLENYKDRVGEEISLEREVVEVLLGDNRMSLDNVVLTHSVCALIELMEARFVTKKHFWSSILVKGPSGSGKSIALALAASYLKQEGFDVIYFRDSMDFQFSTWQKVRIYSESRIKDLILFIDQVYNEGNMMNMLKLGNSLRRFFVVSCGSENLSVVNASSQYGLIKTYEFAPSSLQ